MVTSQQNLFLLNGMIRKKLSKSLLLNMLLNTHHGYNRSKSNIRDTASTPQFGIVCNKCLMRPLRRTSLFTFDILARISLETSQQNLSKTPDGQQRQSNATINSRMVTSCSSHSKHSRILSKDNGLEGVHPWSFSI